MRLSLLKELVSNPALEIEWLDVLSQMEYVGCRKIAKSVHFSKVTLDVLQHLQEEATHAFLLKGVAERMGLPKRPWTEGMFSQVGWNYFQTLDERISAIEPKESSYPWVSWIIEERVLGLYPLYLEATSNDFVKRALRQILAQEKRHSVHFENAVPKNLHEDMKKIENELWSELELAITDLARHSSVRHRDENRLGSVSPSHCNSH